MRMVFVEHEIGPDLVAHNREPVPLGDVGDAIWQRNMMPPIDVVLAFFTERSAVTA